MRFYLDNHKIIPTWILLKICNFSSLITFLERSKTEVIDSLCNLYGFIDTTIPASYKRRHLVGSLQLIRIIRNSAAHNEAIFSFPNRSSRIIDSYVDRMPNSYKKPSNKNIFDLCVALKYYLDDESYTNFSNQPFSLLNDLKATINPIAFDRVRASIGFKHLDHIRTLESLSRIKPLIFKEFPKI